jgi:hypothetical protein
MSTWVARFVVDHGRVTEEGSRLRTFQRRRLDEPDVDLHVMAEPRGAKSEELGAQALDAIGRLFLQDKLSLTGGLQRALGSTHQTLMDWNRRSLPGDQVNIGITAALVSENLVYLAQAGPGLVYVRRSGLLVRHDAGEEAAVPLGGGTLAPALRRFVLEPGDLVLAANTNLQNILDDTTLESLLARPSEETLPELYLLTRDLPIFALFAVICREPEDEADEAEASEPLGRPPEYLERSDVPRRDAPAEPRPESRPNRVVAPAQPVAASPEAEPDTPLNGDAPVSLVATPPPIDISRPLVRLRNEPTPGRTEYARTTGPERSFQFNLGDRRLIQIGAVIAVVLLLVAFVPDLVRENRTQKLADLLAGAELQIQAANAEEDPARRRFHLEETRRLSSEALRIDPVNDVANQLREQATALLAEMNAVFDLGPLTSVVTLSRQVTGDVSVSSVIVRGGSAYMLDTRGGRVISVSLQGGPPAIVYEDNQTYGNTIARSPLFFTWDGPDATGRLLVLDQERKLFEVRPGSPPRPLPLRRTGTWSSVAGIASFDGNLYVLDPAANQVHRYLQAAEGFDSEPTVLLAGQIELGNAVGLEVDGDIYVVLKNGNVRRFRSGADAGFSLAGIDMPITAANDIVILPASEEVYIADTGNKRVVVAGKDGVFRRQLVSSAFTDLRAIAIDSSGAQLYVVIGDALLTAPIVR